MGLIGEVDNLGGALKAVEAGFPQQQIHQAAYSYQKAVEAGDRRIVGVNCHRAEAEPKVEVLKVDDALAARRSEEVVQWREARDESAWEGAMDALSGAAAIEDANLMPLIVEAVEAGATVGEICARLEGVFGKYTPVSVF